MVMEGITMGSFTRRRVVQEVAPSIWAASISSPGMFWRPAM